MVQLGIDLLGGDVFAEPQWLPAQNDCQIQCPITEGLCLIYVNLSANGARIHKHKCRYFPANCSTELQRLLVTTFSNTTPPANTIIALVNNTIISNDTIKYHKGLNKTRNKIHERLRSNRGNNGTINVTHQPAPGIWDGHRRKDTQFKRKFHDSI
ncbi:unnamed protein product [Onchocerca flexuosa]|uniref:DDE Tnp4 domain-containing protein n=1 Tax=Onchocerca flexuosa TaxID=387005 RepID=A0A183HER3_9BILA|nr:unnamed protein product [Onchocerca flexuosa]